MILKNGSVEYNQAVEKIATIMTECSSDSVAIELWRDAKKRYREKFTEMYKTQGAFY